MLIEQLKASDATFVSLTIHYAEYAFVLGCTDVTACNYDPTAEQDEL